MFYVFNVNTPISPQFYHQSNCSHLLLLISTGILCPHQRQRTLPIYAGRLLHQQTLQQTGTTTQVEGTKHFTD